MDPRSMDHSRFAIHLGLWLVLFFGLDHAGHDRTLAGSFLLSFFLTLNTQCGPWHCHEAFLVDVFAAAYAFAVLASIHPFQRFLDGLQALEIALMKVIQELFVMADSGEIPLVLGILELDLF